MACVGQDDPDYAECEGTCQHVSIPCNDTCGLTTWRCGEECVDLANITVIDCAGTCQSVALPCDNACPLGYTKCNDTCHLDIGDTWPCGSQCISTSDTCQSKCHPGFLMSETGGCQPPSEICPNDECQEDADCQDGASCVLQGSRFYCQCRLGYRLTPSAEATCPHTGTCEQMVNGVTECDCHGGICPFCNATTPHSPDTLQFLALDGKTNVNTEYFRLRRYDSV